ncbi:restriction endonuclease subunit S [Eubacterium sp. 1001713B170207_170306_E7]|uniref:restriction endonuclease subunit S n=1 Tax=Eubacterium sp. 1001713B170207_170306_E7 TaxID=2787097 RepID=UPI001899C120|nr:restriction endonuclease subunit S [Eubacterium sp. 1001713B170207_170306_E7]
MNYLTELLAFYKWLEANPLSPVLQAYWQLLMYTNNKAAVLADDGRWYWPIRFKIANSRVCVALELENRFQVARARAHLVRHGRLHYHPHGGNRAGEYELIPYDTGLCTLWITQAETGYRTQVWTQSGTPAAHMAAPLINNLNHKQASLLYCNQESPPNIHGFNLLPPLTDTEKAAIQALYPDDEVAAFEAMWAAREKKQKGETL